MIVLRFYFLIKSSKPTILTVVLFSFVKEEQLKGRPGYEHLSEPLHILIEAELPANVIDSRLAKAQEILEELLKPVVCTCFLLFSNLLSSFLLFNLQLISNICRNIQTCQRKSIVLQKPQFGGSRKNIRRGFFTSSSTYTYSFQGSMATNL